MLGRYQLFYPRGGGGGLFSPSLSGKNLCFDQTMIEDNTFQRGRLTISAPSFLAGLFYFIQPNINDILGWIPDTRLYVIQVCQISGRMLGNPDIWYSRKQIFIFKQAGYPAYLDIHPIPNKKIQDERKTLLPKKEKQKTLLSLSFFSNDALCLHKEKLFFFRDQLFFYVER